MGVVGAVGESGGIFGLLCAPERLETGEFSLGVQFLLDEALHFVVVGDLMVAIGPGLQLMRTTGDKLHSATITAPITPILPANILITFILQCESGIIMAPLRLSIHFCLCLCECQGK